MAHTFRYVFEDSLYLGFSEAMPPDEGRKVFRITCPDFNSYFEIIETGNHSSPYLARTSHYANPLSQKVLEWFCDDRLLHEQALQVRAGVYHKPGIRHPGFDCVAFNESHLERIELDIDPDFEAVSRISMIPTLLAVICQSTGMGFAAVARVTENKWIACGVRDDVSFGLKAGDELKIETTICNEIRKNQKVIIIDHVDEDITFCDHPTPKMYGFQSYISMPIIRRNGDFFGTLCALDPKPARLKIPAVIGMFELFADLISFHLDV